MSELHAATHVDPGGSGSHLDSILDRLQGLGESAERMKSASERTLYSVPDLPGGSTATDEDASTDTAREAEPPSLRLITGETTEEVPPSLAEPVLPPVAPVQPATVANASAVFVAPQPPPVPVDAVVRSPEPDPAPVVGISIFGRGAPSTAETAAQPSPVAPIGETPESVTAEPVTPESVTAEPVAPEPVTAEPVAPQTGFLADYRPNSDGGAVEDPVARQPERVADQQRLPAAARAHEPVVGAPPQLPPAAQHPEPSVPPVAAAPPEIAVEKVDYFADLESAEDVAIAGVDDTYHVDRELAEPVAPTPSEPAATTTTTNPFAQVDCPEPFPKDQQYGPLVDTTGILNDPLAISRPVPETFDADPFSADHGVAFPTAVPGATQTGQKPIHIPAQVRAIPSRDGAETEDNFLSTRLLIVATLLFSIIAFVILTFADSSLALDVSNGLNRLLGN